MKQKVFNLIILDESGSMSSIAQQAITGVNETVQTIRHAQEEHQDQEHYVTVVSFNTMRVNTIYDTEEASLVEELTTRQYRPGYGTPLYDAMGNALTKLREKVEENDVVLVTIITDGYENASKEYNRPAIKALVNELKKKDWVFTYIGANQDVNEVASSISITNTLEFNTSVEGTRAMFAKESKSRNRFFTRLAQGMKGMLSDDYFTEEDL